MKRVLGLVLAGIISVGVAGAFAGDGCCAGGKAKAQSSSACTDMFSKLNLTADQKTKLTALKEQAQHATSTSERQEIFSKGLEQILTPQQLTQWKADCEKGKAAGNCPYLKANADKKS